MTRATSSRPESLPTRGLSRVAWVTLLVLVNLAFLVWWFSGVFARAFRGCESFVGADKVACESANGGTPAATVVVIWIITDLVLLTIWWVRHRRAPQPELPTRPDA
jgi:hypothetical protein